MSVAAFATAPTSQLLGALTIDNLQDAYNNATTSLATGTPFTDVAKKFLDDLLDNTGSSQRSSLITASGNATPGLVVGLFGMIAGAGMRTAWSGVTSHDHEHTSPQLLYAIGQTLGFPPGLNHIFATSLSTTSGPAGYRPWGL